MIGMKNILICDIDGTLANIDHRIPLVRCPKPDYDTFYERVGQDTVNAWCFNLIHATAQAGFRIVLVSGRPARCLPKTEKWLFENSVHYDELHLVRKDHDYTPDHELKRAWLRSYPDRDKILFWIDDRSRVVDAIRDEGITVLQCSRWEEYKRPKNDQIKALEAVREEALAGLVIGDSTWDLVNKALGFSPMKEETWEPLRCERHNKIACFQCEIVCDPPEKEPPCPTK